MAAATAAINHPSTTRMTKPFMISPVARRRRAHQTVVLCKELNIRKLLPRYVSVVDMAPK